MCTSSINSIEKALIQLQYALGDYYCCNSINCDAEFIAFDAALDDLLKSAISVHLAIGLLGAKPKIASINHKAAISLHAGG